MPTQDIRLRLAVRRHGVPEVKLVWPCKRSADGTIAKLLAAVNEVVPLESGEWGLEDYAVELVGADGDTFECLHFQLVAQTLKDEDQLIIRSLLTDDVRRRRISGRHQISADGKHLVDGLAFGRPWLRAPRDRPTIELPPRKRARIAAHEMGVTDPDPERMLMLEAPPHDDDDDDDDDYDESDEYGGVDKHWKPKLRRNMAHDLSEQEENDASSSDGSDSDEEHLECSRDELDEELKALQDTESAGKADHPDTNECSVEHLAAMRTAYPLLSFATIERELSKQKQNLRKTYDALQKTTTPSLSFDDMMDRMVTGILDQSESSSPLQEQPVDIFFNRPSPTQRPLIEEVVSDGLAGSSSSDVTSSDDDSSSDSSSDDEDNGNNGADIANDDDDDDDDEDSSFHGDVVSSSESSSDDSSDQSSDESSSDSSDESVSEPVKGPVNRRVQQDSAPPSQGLSRTQKRNARRRKQKAMSRQSTSTPSCKDAELRARKEALLGALQTDVGDAGSPEVASTEHGAVAITPDGDQNAAAATSAETSARRRARVDTGAGRRMLFGALGLKNPKSKEDEERIRQELMKDVKPLHNPRIVEVNDGTDDPKQATLEDDVDPDAWKSKITYRAVECCHEGMNLSEPPFPFVQRWDPQQRYGSMRKRKRRAEEFEADDYEPSPSDGSKSTRRDPFKGKANGIVDTDATDIAATTFVSNGINGHAEAYEADEEQDLPQVPEDPSNLPVLEKGAAKKGMVITWKQCIMSKATQWQPVISSITGEVLHSDPHEPGSIQVRLAYRDREYKEKLYDEKTGQRIYDKFETPDFEDEDDEEEDDGLRIVGWEEMAEPRILAATSPWVAKVAKVAKGA
ncbi:hypothetical protein E4U43_001650 [Claviceps pusilla]|uniref:DUF7357 domain-containing protein n=1 Tax=Claviceps pusilla TaxID=123648 RepID=A0A9P7SYY7_9HYPO|nr:hypothetical protein E4U43_001650 [Claviceps pusilla]